MGRMRTFQKASPLPLFQKALTYGFGRAPEVAEKCTVLEPSSRGQCPDASVMIASCFCCYCLF